MNAKCIDWDEIRRRVEGVRKAIEKGYSPGPEERTRVLKARAAALAGKPEEADDHTVTEVVEFRLADECYAIESSYVGEVYPVKDYTPLPGAPPFVFGLINVRGRIVSVVDIRKFFDMPVAGLSDLNRILIIRDETMEFGILADSIVGVRWLKAGEIQPPLPTLTGIRAEFLVGVTREGAVVLDGKKLLTNENIIVNQEP